MCELVEACTQELQSGWRPLFGALRSVRIEYTANEAVNEARQRHVAAVLDVFEVYLNTDNILVFANATVDCILCLLKYVHGSGEFSWGWHSEWPRLVLLRGLCGAWTGSLNKVWSFLGTVKR